MNGRSQAIRLPKEFRVLGTEVTIDRVPGGVLIRDDDPWDVCQAACEDMSEGVLSHLEKRNSKLTLEKRDFGSRA